MHDYWNSKGLSITKKVKLKCSPFATLKLAAEGTADCQIQEIDQLYKAALWSRGMRESKLFSE
jgi:hypothetical protein